MPRLWQPKGRYLLLHVVRFRTAIAGSPTVIEEYLARGGPILAVAAGMIAWPAQIRATTSGYGFFPDLVLGLVGNACAGSLAAAFVFMSGGTLAMVTMCTIGVVGAVSALAIQRAIWPTSARP
jgi:uncharacterized membrane protein YeaQ/YmgE (transglycosylase-associated protein family)